MIIFTTFWATFTLLLNTAMAAFGAWLASTLFGALVVATVVCAISVAYKAIPKGPLECFL
jgi:hypothetical protein